jgi:hypothetical protein
MVGMDRAFDGGSPCTRSSSGDGRTVSCPSSPADGCYGDRQRWGFRRRFDSGRGLEAPVEHHELSGGLGRSWDGVERASGGAQLAAELR